jgi:acyl-CoA thioesterase-1
MKRMISFLPYGSAGGFLKALLFLLLAAAVPARAAGPMLVLALGDSLTAGYRLKPAESFPAQLQAALRREGRDVVVHNGGVSGDTAAQGKARLDWVLAGLKRNPDVAIVALGANDMLRGQPVAPMRASLDAIVAELKARGTVVIVAGMLAAPNLGKAYASEYNAVFPAVAKKHGALFYPFFTDGVTAVPSLLLADQMHPNARGVGVMVTRMLPVVRQGLARAEAQPARQVAAR